MQIVGRKFTHAEFKAYLAELNITPWVKFVVVHNTSAPDIALYKQWTQRPNWTPEQWLRNLTSYYAGMGWNGTPHLFIPPVPDQILVLNSLLVHGTHTPSWNGFSVGVETVGEFEREPFSDPTRDNLIVALAALHEKLGLKPDPFQLGVAGLHFHKEDKNTTHKTCPGRNMAKADLVAAVIAEMEDDSPEQEQGHIHVPIAAQEADTNHMSIEELTSVKWLQVMLNRWNAKRWGDVREALTVDGILGKKRSHTRLAVREFQTSMHLTVDGIPGPETRVSLKTATK